MSLRRERRDYGPWGTTHPWTGLWQFTRKDPTCCSESCCLVSFPGVCSSSTLYWWFDRLTTTTYRIYGKGQPDPRGTQTSRLDFSPTVSWRSSRPTRDETEVGVTDFWPSSSWVSSTSVNSPWRWTNFYFWSLLHSPTTRVVPSLPATALLCVDLGGEGGTLWFHYLLLRSSPVRWFWDPLRMRWRSWNHDDLIFPTPVTPLFPLPFFISSLSPPSPLSFRRRN